jgi:DNA-binding transcriptional LysR family regulator
MTLAQLQVLVAVIQAGTFTGAAERLNMTQSAASHALAGLETELGVTLMERDRGGVTLTEIGKKVLFHAQEILSHAESIRQETSAARGLEIGKVRIGTFPSVSARLLPGILRAFNQNFPGIDVVLFEGTDEEVAEWIVSGIVDMGFVTQVTENIPSFPIAHDEMMVVVPAAHRFASCGSVALEKLTAESLIMSKSGCDLLVQGIFRANKLTINPKYEVTDANTILAMVEEELGVAIMAEMVLPEKLSGVRAVSLEPCAYRFLALGVRSMQTISPAAKVFIQQAQEWAKAHGYLVHEGVTAL